MRRLRFLAILLIFMFITGTFTACDGFLFPMIKDAEAKATVFSTATPIPEITSIQSTITPSNITNTPLATQAITSAPTVNHPTNPPAIVPTSRPTNKPAPKPTAAPTNDPVVINSRGNSGGNIANDGLVAQQGSWIYYSNPSDGKTLYKIRTDGSRNTKYAVILYKTSMSSEIGFIIFRVLVCIRSALTALKKRCYAVMMSSM